MGIYFKHEKKEVKKIKHWDVVEVSGMLGIVTNVYNNEQKANVLFVNTASRNIKTLPIIDLKLHNSEITFKND